MTYLVIGFIIGVLLTLAFTLFQGTLKMINEGFSSSSKKVPRNRILIAKIENLQLPFFARDNTELKMGYDRAKSEIIQLIKEEEK